MIVLPAISLSNCTQNINPGPSGDLESTESSQIPDSYTTYNDPDFLFTISFPHTWKNVSILESVVKSGRKSIDKIKSGETFNRSLVLAVGHQSHFDSDYFPILSILVDHITSGDMLLDRYVRSSITDMRQRFDDYREISKSELSINNNEAVILEFETTAMNKEAHNYVLFVVRDNQAWEIDIMCLKSDLSYWEQDFITILESFSFLE
jgi:hypothetical protein